MVAMDWTDSEHDGHAIIALNLLTEHGRAIPLIWRTVHKSALKNNRNEFEDSLLLRLHETLPQGVEVTVVADWGFMDVALLEGVRTKLNFGYITRLRRNIKVPAY